MRRYQDPNKIITDQMLNLWLPCRARCPKGRSEGLWAAPLSKAVRPPIEHDERSFSMWRSTNPSKGAKGSITRSLVPPSVSRAVQCRRSDRIAKNVEIAMMGWRRRIRPMVAENRSTKALQSPLAPIWAPSSTTKPKVRHLVGEKIIWVLLTRSTHLMITSRR